MDNSNTEWVVQWPHNKTFESPEEAIAFAEKEGRGEVVRFFKERNMPHCLPAWVSKSSGMWTFNRDGDGKWWSHYIYDGHGGKLKEEKPH